MTPAPEGIAALPLGLERDRHVHTRRHTPWVRRGAVVVMVVFIALALANIFGQVSDVSTVDSPAAALRVDSPTRLRGGLIFTSVITVVVHQKLQDAKLVLSPGWFDGMTLNAQAPQSNQQDSDAGGTSFDFGSLDAGSTMPVWISWQTNPTTVGRRSTDVTLEDGDKVVASVHRSVYVFP